MDIFGIGPLEIVLILLLVLIVFGPKDLEKAGKSIGRSLNKLIRSESWRTMQQTGRELRNLPNRLMRESGLEELNESTKAELEKTSAELKKSIPLDKDT